MKAKRLTLALAFLTLSAAVVPQRASARLTKAWTYKEMEAKSDLVVIATLVATANTAEQKTLSVAQTHFDVVGVSSLFEVKLVIKGRQGKKNLRLHH
jgi:hypothetical protein